MTRDLEIVSVIDSIQARIKSRRKIERYLEKVNQEINFIDSRYLQSDSSGIEQRLLLVADSRDDFIPGMMRQLGISLRYSKLLAETWDLATAAQFPQLYRYTSVLFLSPVPEEMLVGCLPQLHDYVISGGSITFLAPTISDPALDFLGMVSLTVPDGVAVDPEIDEEKIHGIHFTAGRFAGLGDTTVFFHDVSNKQQVYPVLREDAMVDAYFVDRGVRRPAIWHRGIGLGEIAVWLFVPTGRHWGRSFLLHAALQGQPVSVKSIANTAVFQLDDFPAPPADEPVEIEKGRAVEWGRFIDEYWLQDLSGMADRFRLTYSCGQIFHYDERTRAPFGFEGWDSAPGAAGEISNPGSGGRLRWAQQHGELGLHGYNHLPLTLEHWSSREHMVAGLRACMEWWQSVMPGNPPTSYIPPMNVYDQEGVLALGEACPTVSALCGNFWGPVSSGGGREFSPERWNRKLFCLPRVTSGYSMDPSLKWKMLAGIYELGVWTHFIHPDDILDMPTASRSAELCRNPHSRTWRGPEGLREELERMLSFVRTTFPWITFDTATIAAGKISDHLANRFSCRFEGEHVIVESKQECHAVVSLRGSERPLENIDGAAELLAIGRTSGTTTYTLRIGPGSTRLGFGP